MTLTRTRLLADNAALRQQVADQQEALRAREAALAAALEGIKLKALEIEKLKIELARLKRLQFGRSSEKLNRTVAQLELALEELEAAEAEQAAAPDAGNAADQPAAPPRQPPRRGPLPATLPREEQVHEPDQTTACPRCGGGLRRMGEDRTPVLDYVPGHFKVVEHVRPKFSCRACEAVVQAPASLPIERGRLGPGLLAHVLVGKFDDHLPLYRQSEIFARSGIALSRSTLADQIGHTVRLLRLCIGVEQ